MGVVGGCWVLGMGIGGERVPGFEGRGWRWGRVWRKVNGRGKEKGGEEGEEIGEEKEKDGGEDIEIEKGGEEKDGQEEVDVRDETGENSEAKKDGLQYADVEKGECIEK